MKEFILIFRMDILTPEIQPTAEQMEMYMVQWNEWIDSISAAGQLEGGNHLAVRGKVLRGHHKRIDQPYASNHESVAGYILVRVKDEEEALRIAEKCPILDGDGTSVEIRETANPESV